MSRRSAVTNTQEHILNYRNTHMTHTAGGQIVPTSTQEDELCINGMSFRCVCVWEGVVTAQVI